MSFDSSRWRLAILLQMLELYLVLLHPFFSKLFDNHMKDCFTTGWQRSAGLRCSRETMMLSQQMMPSALWRRRLAG